MLVGDEATTGSELALHRHEPVELNTAVLIPLMGKYNKEVD